MRISTSLIYSQGYDGIASQQSQMLQTQQQIAANKKLLTPADDPVAAAQVQSLTQSVNQTALYAANVTTATGSQQQLDSYMQQVNDILQSVRTLAVNAGSASLSTTDRASIATEVQGDAQSLLALANTRGADGKYVFSGLSTSTQPFTATAQGATYNGDQGQHQLQVAAGRLMAVNLSGSAVFEQALNGNGTLTTRAAAANTGSGVVAAGTVVTPAALTGHAYSLKFAVTAGVTTYDVLDVTAGTTVSTGNAYTDGAAITVAGAQTSVSGSPANGDTFSLAPSSRQSIFTTLQNLVNTLQTPSSTAGASTQVANGVAAALQDLDGSINNVLTQRATLGANLTELDSLTSAQSADTLQDQTSISGLQDLDYNAALSDFAKQQVALQAAQQSFAKISNLSLFNYIGLTSG